MGFNSLNSPYEACDKVEGCDPPGGRRSCLYCRAEILELFKAEKTSSLEALPTPSTVTSLTTANITLFKLHGLIDCRQPEGEGRINFLSVRETDFNYAMNWKWVPDGDSTTIMGPYECYGDIESIGPVMQSYVYPKGGFEVINSTYDTTICRDLTTVKNATGNFTFS